MSRRHLFAPLAVAALAVPVATVAFTAHAVAAPGDKDPVAKKAEVGPPWDPGKGPQGGNVLVTGRNFGTDMKLIEVTINNLECLVLDVQPEAIRFLLPAQVPVGKHKVKITRTGGELGSGSVTIDFEIQKKTDEMREKERKANEVGGNEEQVFAKKNAAIKVNKFELQEGGTAVALLEGSVDNNLLPDGFEIHVALGFSLPQGINTVERVFDSQLVKIKKGTFVAKFSYPGRNLLAGRYFTDVTFDASKQSQIVLKKNNWPGRLKPEERDFLSEIHYRNYCDSLTEADKLKQEEEYRNHYLDIAAKTGSLVENLDRGFVCAGKSFFRKGTTLDEPAWEDWIKKRRLSEDEQKRAKTDMRYVTRGYQLDPEKWQAYITGDVFKNLQEITAKHQVQKKKYVGARDPEAEKLGDWLVTIVFGMAQNYSEELYVRHKIPLPDELRMPKDLNFDGITQAAKLSRGFFDMKKAELLERLPKGTAPPPKK